MKTLRSTLAFAALLAVLVSCGDNPTEIVPEPDPPMPGTLALVLQAPHAADGAISFRLQPSGDLTIERVRPAGGDQVLHLRPGTGSSLQVFVMGGVENGKALVLVDVSDVRTPSALASSVLEVAAPDYSLRIGGNYSLTAVREH
jgi:hypothetical protein